MLAIAIVGSLVLVIPMRNSWLPNTAASVLLLIPQAMIPALVPAAAFGLGTRAGQPFRILSASMLLTFMAIASVGWGVPLANQSYRVAVSQQPAVVALSMRFSRGSRLVPTRGRSEMTAGDIARSFTGDAAGNRTNGLRELGLRAGLVVAVPTALVLGAAIRRRLGGRRWLFAQLVSASAAVGLYFMVDGATAFSRSMGLAPPVRLDLAGLNVWLWIAIAWGAVAVVSRTKNAEPGTRQVHSVP